MACVGLALAILGLGATAAAALAYYGGAQSCDPQTPTRLLSAACRGALAAERSAKFAQWTSVTGSVQVAAFLLQMVALIFTLRESNRGSRAATQAAAAASRQAEFAERGTETGLRAYVLVDTCAVRHRLGEDTVIRLTVKNFGQTPAFSAKAWVHSWVEAFPLAADLPEPPEDLPMSDQVMGPGFRSTYTHRHSGKIEGVGQHAIESGRCALYVYGAVTYQDVFGKTHRTRFLLFCQGKGALAAGALGAYPQGNEAD